VEVLRQICRIKKLISLCCHHICNVCRTNNISYIVFISAGPVSLAQLNAVVTRMSPWNRTLAETFARPPSCFFPFCPRFPYQNLGLYISQKCVTVRQDPKLIGAVQPTLHTVLLISLDIVLGYWNYGVWVASGGKMFIPVLWRSVRWLTSYNGGGEGVRACTHTHARARVQAHKHTHTHTSYWNELKFFNRFCILYRHYCVNICG
jgi:hypothetical protein